jgi:hypothetical protein
MKNNKSGKPTIKINFENVKDNKLYFYEKYRNKTKVEYAFIEENNQNISFKPEDDIELHSYPKNRLNEFLLNRITEFIEEKFNKRIDLKSKTSKPFFNMRLLSVNIPTIVFISIKKGLLDALKWYKFRYTFNANRIKDVDTKDGKSSKIRSLKLNDGSILNIYLKDLFDEYLINGLFQRKKWIENHFDSKNINDNVNINLSDEVINEINEIQKTYPNPCP